MHPTNPTCPFCGEEVSGGYHAVSSSEVCPLNGYSFSPEHWARRPVAIPRSSSVGPADHSVTAAEIGFLLGRSYSGSDEPAAKQVAEKLGIKLKERS